MLDWKTLQNERIVDNETLWKLRPSWIPGGFDGYLRPGASACFLSIHVPIFFPNGQMMTSVYCQDLKGAEVGDRVLFTLRPASVREREKRGQPDLMEAAQVRIASPEDYAHAIKEYEDRINSKLARNLEEQLTRLNEQVAETDRRAQALQKEIDDCAEQKVSGLRTELETQYRTLTAELDDEKAVVKGELERLSIKETEVVALQQSLEITAAQLEIKTAEFERIGGEKLISFLGLCDQQSSLPVTSIDLEPLPDTPAPAEVVQCVQGHLRQANYYTEHALVLQILLAVCTAAATGQFIVLTGPPGSGKTSLVTKLAQALGAGEGKVPVRPAWIDPTDLIGFLDPRIDRFQPAPFMDYLLQAQEFSRLNRLFFLVLDEMNLGRVENYAADFMSLLEKAREQEQGAELPLYSHEMEIRLRRSEAHIKAVLCQNVDKTSDVKREELARTYAELRDHTTKYPARVSIPEGLVLFGTINVDETTAALSPKFLDRALVIQIPNAELPTSLSAYFSADTTAQEKWLLSCKHANALVTSQPNYEASVQTVWSDLVNWNEKYLKALGICLSYRFVRCFKSYMSVAQGINVHNTVDVADALFLAKLLPTIRFHRDDKAAYGTETKHEVLDNWMNDTAVGRYSLLRNALERMLDHGGLMVQYLE